MENEINLEEFKDVLKRGIDIDIFDYFMLALSDLLYFTEEHEDGKILEEDDAQDYADIINEFENSSIELIVELLNYVYNNELRKEKRNKRRNKLKNINDIKLNLNK